MDFISFSLDRAASARNITGLSNTVFINDIYQHLWRVDTNWVIESLVQLVISLATPNTRQMCQPACPARRELGDSHSCDQAPEGPNSFHLGITGQPCTILHSCRLTLLICGSASLARSFTHAGIRCSSAAVPALHDPSLMQADAAHLRQCQPCTILHSCRQTLLIVAPNEKLVVWFAALFELGAWIIDLQTRCALQVIC